MHNARNADAQSKPHLCYQKDYNYVFSIFLLPKQYIRELIQKKKKKKTIYKRQK